MQSEQRAFITTYDGTYRYTYDPWNRLVKTMLNAAGDQGGSQQDIIIQTAKYDGLGRRVTERARGGSVKEYIDEIVAMRTEFGRAYVHLAEGDQGGSLKDWNVIGLTDITGRSLERYYYSPYGELEAVRDAHFFDYDDDGDVDSADSAALTACIGETSGDCLRFDADADGTITQDDAEAFSSYTATLTTNTELQRIPATTSGSLGNPFGHQGLAFDAEIGSYQNRARQNDPKLKRFMQRDPLTFRSISRSGYQDGANLFQYLNGNPIARLDSFGLKVESCRRKGHGPFGMYFHCYIKTDGHPNGVGLGSGGAVGNQETPTDSEITCRDVSSSFDDAAVEKCVSQFEDHNWDIFRHCCWWVDKVFDCAKKNKECLDPRKTCYNKCVRDHGGDCNIFWEQSPWWMDPQDLYDACDSQMRDSCRVKCGNFVPEKPIPYPL